MAIVTRRYSWQGLSAQELASATDPGLALSPTHFQIFVDVTFDDTVASIAAMDTQLLHRGFAPDTNNTSDPPNGSSVPFIGVQSPDGSIWEIQVSDLGVISTVKRSP